MGCSAISVTSAKLFLVDGRAHYYFGTPMSWSAARSFCLNMCQDLPSIKSAAHNQAIVAALSAGVTGELSIHIGANDLAQEGSFVWADKSPWDYTNWYARFQQPDNNLGIEHCAELFLGSTALDGHFTGAAGYWNDEPCHGYAAHVVCAAGTGNAAGEPPCSRPATLSSKLAATDTCQLGSSTIR
jgi:hypothetical protein